MELCPTLGLGVLVVSTLLKLSPCYFKLGKQLKNVFLSVRMILMITQVWKLFYLCCHFHCAHLIITC